ncbi:MAG: TAXI family TRAP transporter solute-binding subunit [Clostridia bacterium]|nr:TAXI family TRAP transporter solute-binding subunit [Clostridia bacterium]
MKKILAIALAAIMLFAFAACGGDKTGTDAPATKMTMGTGGTGGTYYAYGNALGSQIKTSTGISVSVVPTDGSKANILGIVAGDYQLGTVQSDVMSYAWDGTRSFEAEGKIEDFRVIAGLYAEAVQLITIDPEIKTVADLKGKKVSVGAAGSGVYFNAVDVLGAAGLTIDDIDAQYQSFNDSKDALLDGKIQAAFVVAGAPTPAVTDLATSKEMRLIPIDGELSKALMDNSPFYTEYVVPAGTYKGQEEDVTTVTVKATLIVSASASENDVYNITKAIFDNIDAITTAHAKGAELTLENATSGMTVPFHAGAAKYFAEKGVTVEAK